MRADNDSNQTTFKPDSRLINSIIRGRKRKRPNAQKHGLYARPLIIPGEDPAEFDQILAERMAYWKPAGPELRDAVIELAETLWRKRRLKNYAQTQLYLCTFEPRHPAFDEVWGFMMFMECLRTEPEECFEKHAKKYLRRGKIDDLEQKFLRTKYQLTSEWANAITTEILTVLLPAVPGSKPPEPGSKDDLEQLARKWRADQKVSAFITDAREFLEYELKETERLNAMIDKQTRRCAELKTWEEAQEARDRT